MPCSVDERVRSQKSLTRPEPVLCFASDFDTEDDFNNYKMPHLEADWTIKVFSGTPAPFMVIVTEHTKFSKSVIQFAAKAHMQAQEVLLLSESGDLRLLMRLEDEMYRLVGKCIRAMRIDQ